MPESLAPGGGKRDPVRLLRVPAEGVTTVTFLGPCRGHLEHFIGKRTVACRGASCPTARHSQRVLFYGYAPVEVWSAGAQTWTAAVLQMTAALEENMRGRTLRGETWALNRVDDGDKQSRLEGIFLHNAPEPELGPTFDVEPILARIFGESSLILDVRNPNPARILRSANARPGPDLSRISPPPAELAEPTEEVKKRFVEALRNMRNGGGK